MASVWRQTTIQLPRRGRGCYLVTNDILKDLAPLLRDIKIGLVNIFVQHTSCALTINENADPDVRVDMTEFLNRMAPDSSSYFQHTDEGPDDMTGHIKSSVLGVSLTIPVTEGRLNLGTWQGIWLVEARTSPHSRTVVCTVNGSTQ